MIRRLHSSKLLLTRNNNALLILNLLITKLIVTGVFPFMIPTTIHSFSSSHRSNDNIIIILPQEGKGGSCFKAVTTTRSMQHYDYSFSFHKNLKYNRCMFDPPSLLFYSKQKLMMHPSKATFSTYYNTQLRHSSSSSSSNNNSNNNNEYFSSNNDEENKHQKRSLASITALYFDALRPVTVVQAVGALMVGYLSLASSIISSSSSLLLICKKQKIQLLAAMTSVFLSYGAGMVMNDCVDASSDALHDNKIKQGRAIASGQISQRSARKYVGMLSILSILLGFIAGKIKFAVWSLSNLAVMFGYAMGGWQRIFLVKNVICGWLAISPLIGAWCMVLSVILVSQNNIVTTTTAAAAAAAATAKTMASSSLSSLGWLAAVGFPMHVAREIVKDIEDVNVDRGNKRTLPIVVGERLAHRIAYGIVGAVCSLMVLSPIYWNLFGPSLCYPVSVAIGIPLCIRAYLLPIEKGQKVLKSSIYVLLAGMIGGLLSNS